jgi:hypothetical protein
MCFIKRSLFTASQDTYVVDNIWGIPDASMVSPFGLDNVHPKLNMRQMVDHGHGIYCMVGGGWLAGYLKQLYQLER